MIMQKCIKMSLAGGGVIPPLPPTLYATAKHDLMISGVQMTEWMAGWFHPVMSVSEAGILLSRKGGSRH